MMKVPKIAHPAFLLVQIADGNIDSHRLIAFAKREGKQHQMKEALMSTYFESQDRRIYAVREILTRKQKGLAGGAR